MKRFTLLLVVVLLTSVITVSAQDSGNRISINLENAASVSEIAALEGHEGAVNSVAFCLDGTLASAGEDTSVLLWDVSTGEERQLLEGHTAIVYSVACSPDGTQLASTGQDLAVLVWDIATGAQLSNNGLNESNASFAHLMDSGLAFLAVTWVDEATPFAVGHFEFSNFSRGMERENPHLYAATTSSNGIVAVGTGDNEVRLVDHNNPDENPYLTEHSESVLSVAFSPDGSLLASGSADDTIRLWDVTDIASVASIAVLPGHTGDVTGVAFSPDGTLLVSSSLDGTLRLWSVETQEQLGVLSSPDGVEVRGVAFSSDGTLIASAGSDGVVRLWGVAGEAETSDASNASEIPTETTEIVTSFGTMTVNSARFIDAYPEGCDPKVNFSCFAVPTQGMKILIVYFDGVSDGNTFTGQHEKARVTDVNGATFEADLYGFDAGLNFYGFAVPQSTPSVKDFSLVWNDGEDVVIPLVLAANDNSD